MESRKSRPALMAAFAVAAGACVTVNLYFPTAEVQKAADQIVEEVHQGKTQAPAAGSSLLGRLSVVALTDEQYAAILEMARM